jgi:AraC-like DNA-binding protein
MPDVPRFAIDLGKCPRIAQTGLSLHGSRATESFRLRGLWSLHAYHYRGEIEIEGRVFPFLPGWVSLVPPETLVKWHFASYAQHYYVHFAVARSRRRPVEIPLLQDFGEDFDGFCGQFEEMIQFHSFDPERAAVRLWDLLHQARREPAGSRPTEALHPHLQIALSMIRSRQSEKIRVGQIARTMGVSHNHLTSLFRRRFGCGAVRYIQRERLARACHLLAHSSLSVKSIAIETGIPDLHYFNKLIRRTTGRSPRAYRILRAGRASAGQARRRHGCPR